LFQADNGAFTIGRNGGSERIRILTNGAVGIGIRAPEQMLSVRDTLLVGQYEGIIPPGGKSANFILRATDGFSPGIQGSAYTYFQRDTTDIARFGITPNNSINFDHWDGSAWLSRMVISSIGFVGVGTNAPSTLLHVQGGANGAALLTLDSEDGNAMGMDAGIIINSDNINGSDAAYLIFMNNGVQSAKFLGGTSGSGFDLAASTTFGINQDGFVRLHMTDMGNFGFATDTPAYRLDVAGDARLTSQFMLGRYAINPVAGNQAGSMIYNTADLVPYYWDGTQWIAFATGTVADQVTLDLAYDGGGFGAGKFIITDAGPIEITNTTGTLGFMSVTHSTDAEGLWVNNLGNGSAFSARNMGAGSGFYSRNQGTGYGARFDNSTSNGIGLYIDNPNDGVGFRLNNAGSNFGAWIENTGTGYGMQIRSMSPLGTGLYIRQSAGYGMLLDNNTGNRGIEINNNATGTGLFVYNMSSEPGIEMYDIGGKTGLLIDKPLNGGNAVEINTDDGARAYYNIHNGTAEAFWMRNIGTGPSLWIEDAASDPSPFVLTSAGQLGIGTAAPVTLLHVQGGLNGRAVLTLDSDDGNADGQDAGIYINSDHANGSDAAFIEFANNGVVTGKTFSSPFDAGFMVNGNVPYRIYTNSNERMTVAGDGNIGLSTSTPAYRLDVAGDSRLSGQFMLGRYASLPVSGYQAGSLVYKTSSSTINYWDGTQWRTVATAEDVRSSLWDEDHDTGVQVEESADEDYIRFDTAGVERMYIRNDGYVGIGTDNPLVSLLMVGPGSHEASSFSVAGISGMLNIANFRDENGENVFRAGGSVAGNDLVVGFGDLDYGGIGTSMQVNYGANAIELSHSELRLMDQFGGEYVGFIAPTALTGNTIWTLPSADGTNNQVLITDGAGTLSWATSSDLVYNIYNSDGLIPEDRDVTIADGYELRFADQSNPANFLYFQPDYNTNGNLRIGAVNNDEGNTNHYLEFMDNFKMVSQHGIEIDASTSQVDLYGNNAVLHIGADNQFYDFRAAGSRYGLRYESDYSADFVARSLVDKAYVDNAIVSATTTLQAAYDAGGSALGRQIYTLNSANPVEILNPGTDQWETSLALTNAVNGGGLAIQTMEQFGDLGARMYFTDDTSDPENGSGAYMNWNNNTESFEFGYQRSGTRDSNFYIDYSQMALQIPGSASQGAFSILATNYNVPILQLRNGGASEFTNNIKMSVGTSTPEAKVTAYSGSMYYRTDGTGSGQQVYVKTTDVGNTGWVALAGADSNHWQKNTNVLSPTDSAVYQVNVTNNSASTLTGFKAVNTNDASNYAGAVLELKGSGADFTNNIYFGKYGSNFYVPSWAGNGVLATDKNLVIGSVGTGTLIRFQVGGGYTAPTSRMTLDTDSLDLLAGVSLNVGGNTVLGDATSDTITFTARANSSLLPATTNLYSLGSTTNRWSDLWAGTVHVGTSTWDLAQVADGAFTIGQNGGSERMRITSTGYVGIGTTTPAYRLDLVGDARVNAQLMLGQYALNPASGLQAGAMVYNTASSTPFFWNGSEWKALNGGIPNAIWDVTHDTGITTEYLPDEDILRFFTGDVNYFTMEGPHLSVLNSGNSVFFGQNAGRADNLSNRQNVYVGSSAGYNSATGLYNVAVGYQALYNHAAPNNTTAIGHSAGRNYSGAFGGTMVGYYAGYQSSGNNNVMIGYESGMENTGSDNFFMGRGTGWYNTGNNNIMMGYYTGYDARGSNNIFFGTNAGYENRGSDNIFLGVSAGSKSIGNDNIFLGYQAGIANTTGTRNLFLGRQAGNNNVLGSGNIFLGYQAGYSETNSNRLYIDNSNTSAPLVYGEFDTNVLRINGALQINNPSSTGYALPTTDGNSGQILITNGAGNASWVSSSALTIDTFQDVTDRGATTTNWIEFAGGTSTGDIIPGTHGAYSLGNTDSRWSDLWATNVHIGTSTWDLIQAPDGAFTILNEGDEYFRLQTNGRFAIGTDQPEQLFTLSGGNMLIGQWDGGILPSGGYSRQMIIRATDGALPGIQGTAYTTYQRDGVDIAQMGLDTSNNIAFSHYSGSWVRDMVISTAGNVGIGNTVPSRRLDVLGSTTPGDNLFRLAGGANGAYLSMYASTTDDRNMVIEVQRDLQFYSQANLIMNLDNGGNVGFGTVSTEARVNVEQSAGIVAAFDRTNDDGTIVSLRQDGVEEGTISVSGNTISYNAFTGSHYAWTDEVMEKGLLVTLTGENRYLNGNTASEIIYGVTKSSAVNDSKVIGAYLSLQEPSKAHSNKNPHLIMAVGNGEVWVADKGENINIGDYLISSDVAGHAEKDTGEFMVSHIVARAAQSVDWTHVSETINGVKHRKISVFFESFDKNNMQGSLAGTSLQGGENNVEAVDLVVANAVFEGNVTVKGHLAMGRDTVGQAMVLVGDTKVRIDFEEDYGTLPIITLTPAGKVTVPYWVENASLQGFDLVLGEVQYTDVIFNWHAFGSHEGKVFVSNGTTLDIIANDMGTSELETQISANGTTPVPAPVEETEPVAPIADQPVPEEPEVVDEPAVVDEGTVAQNEYSEEQEIVVQEESQPVESNESIVPEPEIEPVPQAEIIEEQVIE